MPVSVTFACPKCKGETKLRGEMCLACSMQAFVKSIDNAKHIPSHYFYKKK